MNSASIPQVRNQVFDALDNEITHLREQQARKHFYIYTVTGSLAGQASTVETLHIEQGTDFKCEYVTGKLFSYDGTTESTFPLPSAQNATPIYPFSASGLSFKFTDGRSGRELMSALTPGELIFTPGYGQVFQQPYPFRYYFLQNSQLRIDIYNRDKAARTHFYYLAFGGFKYYTQDA